MTPAQHLETADRLLLHLSRRGPDDEPAELLADALVAIGHALVALAAESGVPHREPGEAVSTSAVP